jgi:hypothetical protein
MKAEGNQMIALEKSGTNSVTTANNFQRSIVRTARDTPTRGGDKLGRAEVGCMLRMQVAKEVMATGFKVRRSLDRRSNMNKQINGVGQTTQINTDKGVG